MSRSGPRALPMRRRDHTKRYQLLPAEQRTRRAPGFVEGRLDGELAVGGDDDVVVIDEFPQFPVASNYEELKAEFARASLRDL
jgi:hypothetical protein